MLKFYSVSIVQWRTALTLHLSVKVTFANLKLEPEKITVNKKIKILSIAKSIMNCWLIHEFFSVKKQTLKSSIEQNLFEASCDTDDIPTQPSADEPVQNR